MRIAWSASFVGLLFLVGCGSGLETHSVKGKVVVKDGNVEDLRKSHVEFVSESDPTVRGSGLIEAEGRFTVEMLHQGQVLHGLPTGKYRARIILSDEGPAAKKGRSLVARRYLDIKTADLSVTVPTTQEVSLNIASK